MERFPHSFVCFQASKTFILIGSMCYCIIILKRTVRCKENARMSRKKASWVRPENLCLDFPKTSANHHIKLSFEICETFFWLLISHTRGVINPPLGAKQIVASNVWAMSVVQALSDLVLERRSSFINSFEQI